MRLSVQLVKYIQLLRYRSQRGMSLKAIIENGDGLAVEVSPNTDANRTRVLNKAQEMVTQGLLTQTTLMNDWVSVILRPLFSEKDELAKARCELSRARVEAWKVLSPSEVAKRVVPLREEALEERVQRIITPK
ncbi:hypothetical protein HYR99_20325 [Candidatus Poribacteria bacterium]|nr:hypothetical protein [Candidatus Poribacteria bacterium]